MKLKNKPKIRLPTWKRYLYSFVERFKIFRRINQGIYIDLFKLKRGEIFIIKNTLIKFGNGGIWERENKFNIMNFYLNFVERNFNRVSLRDVRLAHKISPLRKIQGETLMSEMLTLKKYGKEVNLGFADTKGLSEEELVVKICEAIDEKGKYSKEFKKWYEEVDKKYPALFASSGSESKGSDDEVDIDQLVDAVETADEIKDLKELFDFEPFASEKKTLSKIKEMEELQEAMMEILTAASDDDGKKETKTTVEIDPEVVEAIKASEDVDELKGICQDDDYKEFFSEISMRGRQKVENIKAKMLAALGIEKDAVSEGITEEELSEMSDKDLKAKAAEYDIKPPALMTKKKKEELIEAILEKASESGGKESKEETITPSLIKKAVLAKDIDTLMGMAEELGYKPKFTEKKTPKILGEKLIELISDEKKEEPKKKEKGKDKVESIYSVIERLTKEGKKSFMIIKEVTPMFEALGQEDKDFIKEKVGAMIEVAKMEE